MTMIAINTTTAERMAHVLPLVQEQVPAADADYVYSGAIGVGLNRLEDPTFKFVGDDFDTVTEADSEVDVEVTAADGVRVFALSVALGVDEDLIRSAALCTGMAKLAGDPTRLVGPFEVP